MTDQGRARAPHRAPYRPEIDGLRAIAVVAVILYHGGIPGFSGGFLGVDLFFVISGYLITGILAGELAAGTFSIARFYERRIRRIIPALMLVMLLCIPFALWLMLPDDLENFGQSLIATTLFANNILLLLTSGYFEMEVAFKPLMHSWSLGIEEQYYLIVPLLMWAAWRVGKARGLLIGIAAVTALSFAFCVAVARYSPDYAFFLILSRGWELGAGSLAMLLEPRIRPLARKSLAAMLALAGLALAVLPLFLHSAAAPGLFTAIPIAGLCLVLLFGAASDPTGRILASRPFVAVGLISYSAYLFHQPVFAFVRIASLEPPSHGLIAALLVPVFILAWLSWRFVEQPCRDRSRVSTRALLAGSAAATAIVLAAGLVFHFTSGFYSSRPELAGATQGGRYANIAYNMAPERFRARELPATGERMRVLVIGDSFARDFINMGLETGHLDPQALSLAGFGDCARLGPPARARIMRADFIVIVRRIEPDQIRCLASRVRTLREFTSVPIVVISRKSFGYNNNAVMLLPERLRYTWRVRPSAEAIAINEAMKRALPPEVYVDILALIGDAQGLVPVFTPDRKFISQDREHVTRPGARFIGEILFRHPAFAALRDARKPGGADPR